MSSSLVNAEPPTASSSSSPAVPLTVGSVTRFLSPDYPLPYAPLQAPLSFNETHSWPDSPMSVFSQW